MVYYVQKCSHTINKLMQQQQIHLFIYLFLWRKKNFIVEESLLKDARKDSFDDFFNSNAFYS